MGSNVWRPLGLKDIQLEFPVVGEVVGDGVAGDCGFGADDDSGSKGRSPMGTPLRYCLPARPEMWSAGWSARGNDLWISLSSSKSWYDSFLDGSMGVLSHSSAMKTVSRDPSSKETHFREHIAGRCTSHTGPCGMRGVDGFDFKQPLIMEVVVARLLWNTPSTRNAGTQEV